MKNNHGKNNHRKNNHKKNNHTKNNNRENRMSLGALCLSLVLVLGACVCVLRCVCRPRFCALELRLVEFGLEHRLSPCILWRIDIYVRS